MERVAHGPSGGDLIIDSCVADGRMTAELFLRDPLTAQPHEPDVTALMPVCEVHNTSLATNVASADAVVEFLKKR